MLDDFELAAGIALPVDHRTALQESNGAQVYGGYMSLFGVGRSACVDIRTWNDPDWWKFAWESRCADHLCFAETGWGDQYAYYLPALKRGEPQVYFLDCLSMTPTLVGSTFSDFIKNEFIRSAEKPYDAMITEVRQSFGDLEVGKHLIYVPSPLLGGTEQVANVQTMDARSAMISNGDMATQLDAGPADGNVRAVTTYEDASGCTRLALSWA